MGAQRPKPIHVFISYAHEDEALKDELLKHLAPLRRSGAVSTWHDRDLNAGEPLPQIDAEIDRADVVLLLLSVDYLASDDLHDRELMRSIERHKAGKAKVIPILLRPITIEEDAPFAELTALPSGRKPVASWPSRDEAWSDVVRGLRRALGLPTPEEEDDEPISPHRDEASAARVEVAKSRDRMIIIVVAIVAVTTIFVRTSGAPTPYLAAVTALAVIGAAGSAVRHALRSRKLAMVGAGALAGAAVIGVSTGASAAEGSATSGAGSLLTSLMNAAAVSLTAAVAGIGIGLGVEGTAVAVDKYAMPSTTTSRLISPFDEITSLFAADAGVDGGLDEGGIDEDAGDAGDAGDDAGGAEEDAGILDAGPDASPSNPSGPTGSVDLATFKKNAALAVASAQKEAMVCLRPGITCSGRVLFKPDGLVGNAVLNCFGPDGIADAAVKRCVAPIFSKKRIYPLASPGASTGVNVTVGPFSK